MTSADLTGQVLDEKYQINRLLGAGGMGAVYFATHLGTDRPVAVKVIAPEFMLNDEFVERFRREARAAGRLRHPNVVDVTDFGFARVGQQRVAYLVMEYLDGCTLQEVIAEEKRLPVAWVVDILEQTCSALDEAHQQGIVHRDLKPDNIWLEPNRRGGYTVKVLDFGIARLGNAAEQNAANPEAIAARASATQSAQTNHARSTAFSNNPSETKPHAPRKSSTSESLDSDDFREERTQLLPAQPAGEDKTLIQAAQTNRSPAETGEGREEAGTRIMPAKAARTVEPRTETSSAESEEHTRILERQTPHAAQIHTASNSANLTRVGSILGTPLYMSPEQCCGAVSDARSDIYSLGVIAYQMLAGRTPFAGDMNSILRQHMEAAPPPLDVKRVPKKMAQLVASALAKNPDERPESAASFASALHARSEGAGALVKQAMTLFSEHLKIFLFLALIIHVPLVIINGSQFAIGEAANRGLLPATLGVILIVLFSLVTFPAALFVASVLVGATARLITQLLAAPLRPLQVRPALNSVLKRWRTFLATSLLVNLVSLCLIGAGALTAAALKTLATSQAHKLSTAGAATLVALSALLLIAGFVWLFNFQLAVPVLMMEDVKTLGALKRARQLYKRARRTVIAVVCLQFALPLATSGLIAFLIYSLIKVLNPSGVRARPFSLVFQITQLPVNIVVSAFISILTALLYWKTRQSGGETFRQALTKFDNEEIPRSRWQQRIRERTHMTTRTTR